MGRISEVLKNGAIKGAMSFLSELLVLLHGQFVEGKAADDETKKGLATFVLWAPELHQAAARTDTNFDDQMIGEVMQYAEAVLPTTLIAEARAIYGPEDLGETEPEPAPA